MSVVLLPRDPLGSLPSLSADESIEREVTHRATLSITSSVSHQFGASRGPASCRVANSIAACRSENTARNRRARCPIPSKYAVTRKTTRESSPSVRRSCTGTTCTSDSRSTLRYACSLHGSADETLFKYTSRAFCARLTSLKSPRKRSGPLYGEILLVSIWRDTIRSESGKEGATVPSQCTPVNGRCGSKPVTANGGSVLSLQYFRAARPERRGRNSPHSPEYHHRPHPR
jgi:hypothetical protein